MVGFAGEKLNLKYFFSLIFFCCFFKALYRYYDTYIKMLSAECNCILRGILHGMYFIFIVLMNILGCVNVKNILEEKRSIYSSWPSFPL